MKLLIAISICFCVIGCTTKDMSPNTTALTDQAPAPTSSEAQKTISDSEECQIVTGIIGNADIGFDAKTVINFYPNPTTSGQPAQTLSFYDDPNLKMFSFRPEGAKAYSLLRPEVHKLDYFLFDLFVVKRQNDWLEVIVDDQTNETLWLKESKKVKFADWLKTMKDAYAVGRIAKEKNPLLESPDVNAKTVSFNGRGCFKVEEMRGDWIRVTEQEHCTDSPGQSVSGWIRWRDDSGCLIVEIFPFA